MLYVISVAYFLLKIFLELSRLLGFGDLSCSKQPWDPWRHTPHTLTLPDLGVTSNGCKLIDWERLVWRGPWRPPFTFLTPAGEALASEPREEGKGRGSPPFWLHSEFPGSSLLLSTHFFPRTPSPEGERGLKPDPRVPRKVTWESLSRTNALLQAVRSVWRWYSNFSKGHSRTRQEPAPDWQANEPARARGLWVAALGCRVSDAVGSTEMDRGRTELALTPRSRCFRLVSADFRYYWK